MENKIDYHVAVVIWDDALQSFVTRDKVPAGTWEYQTGLPPFYSGTVELQRDAKGNRFVVLKRSK